MVAFANAAGSFDCRGLRFSRAISGFRAEPLRRVCSRYNRQSLKSERRLSTPIVLKKSAAAAQMPIFSNNDSAAPHRLNH